MLDVAVKPVPVAVSVKAAPPALVLAGEIADSTGAGLSAGGGGVALIAKASACEAPPPGAGFTTDTCADPTVAMSLAGI